MQPAAGDVHVSARVVSKELVGEDICRLRLLPSRSFPYRAGQYLSLRRADGLTRSYSLASVPRIDAFLELHIRRMEGGQMTTYLFDELEAGDSVQFFGPSGSCFYLPGREDAPLLLIGAGTGLSTVVGIARDALTTGHTGPVRLYHGSATRAGLYLDRELKRLEVLYPNLRYTPCLDGAEKAEGCRSGRVTDVAFGEHPNLSGWRVYVSGTAPMVHAAKRRAYLMGASLADLHADPFEHATPPAPGPRQASPWRENRRPCRTGRADCALSCSIHG
jgi:NAD(P)H-flavin reductase